MKTENIERIRTANQVQSKNAGREELYDHCAVNMLLFIIEKGHGLEALNLLANRFRDDMPAVLRDLVRQQPAA